MRYNGQEQKWEIDRHVPITILLAIIIQTIVWIWWVATFTARTELRIDNLEKQTQSLNQLPARMAGLEAKVDSTNGLLRDIRDDMRTNRKQDTK